MPTTSLLRSELGDFVHDALLSPHSACRQFFNAQALEDVVTRQEKGRLPGYQTIWSLLVFELWHRTFVTQSRAAHAHEACVVGL